MSPATPAPPDVVDPTPGPPTGAAPDPATALGRSIAGRFRRRHGRLGTVALTSRRFVAGAGRPLVARRALAIRSSVGAPARDVRSGALTHAAVRAPRWWDVADHAPSVTPEDPARRLPPRGLPRVVQPVPGEKTRRPGGVVAGAAPKAVPMRLPAEVAASGAMLTPQDRRRRTAPASPPTTGSPGNGAETGSRPQAPTGARTGSPQPTGPATPAGPVTPTRTGQFLRRRALTARTVAAARARADERPAARPGSRPAAPALTSPTPGPRAADGRSTAVHPTVAATSAGAASTGATSAGAELDAPTAPTTVPGITTTPAGRPLTGALLGDRTAPVAATTTVPRPLRRAVGVPVRMRSLGARVALGGHGTTGSVVRGAPVAPRSGDTSAAPRPSAPAAPTPHDAGSPSPTTGTVRRLATSTPTAAPASTAPASSTSTPAVPPPAPAAPALPAQAAPLPADSARAGSAHTDSTPAAQPTTTPSAGAQLGGARSTAWPSAPSRLADSTAASTSVPSTSPAAVHTSARPARSGFTGLALGASPITGGRSVRRVAAAAPRTVGPRGLPAGAAASARPVAAESTPSTGATRTLTSGVRTAHDSGASSHSTTPPIATSPITTGPTVTGPTPSTPAAHPVGAGAVPGQPTAPVRRATTPSRPVTTHAVSARATVTNVGVRVTHGGTARRRPLVAVRRLMRSDAPHAPITGPTVRRYAVAPASTGPRGAARNGATPSSPDGAVATAPRTAGSGTIVRRSTAHDRGYGDGPAVRSPLGIDTSGPFAEVRSWAGARPPHPGRPGRVTAPAQDVLATHAGTSGAGSRGSTRSGAGPRTTGRVLEPGSAPASGSRSPAGTGAAGHGGRPARVAVRRSWRGEPVRRLVEPFRPAPPTHGSHDPATTDPTAPGRPGPHDGVGRHGASTGTVRRRSAADGRAVVPPRTTPVSAPARPAAPPAPSGAPVTGAAAASGPLSGPQRLEQALIRRALAETGISTGSVRDRIRQLESAGSQEGSVMSMSSLAPGQPPQVPPSALAFRRDELDPGRSPWDDPDEALLDTIVDRVVERIEDRVVEEIERRGRHRSPGVF